MSWETVSARGVYIDPTSVSMAQVQPATVTTDTSVGVAKWVEGHAFSAFIPIPGPMPEVVHAKTLPMQSGTLEMKTSSAFHLSGSLPLAPVIGMEQSVNTNQLTAELLGPVSHKMTLGKCCGRRQGGCHSYERAHSYCINSNWSESSPAKHTDDAGQAYQPPSIDRHQERRRRTTGLVTIRS